MSPLRLGVIGLSPGNGHPYSWSAIFNGYDPVCMEECGFPVIPRYLEKQSFPQDAIAEAKVTHVWVQNNAIAQHVAKATLIPNVVGHYTDMIGEVDGILLARDDAENHFEFAAPFIKEGIPIYIDKPLALNAREAKKILDLQCYPGQIFSCSALRYAKEFQLSHADRLQVGRLSHIYASVPNDWNKYAVHVIEPLLLLAKERGTIEFIQTRQYDGSTTLVVEYSGGLQVTIAAMGLTCAPLSIRLMGDSGWRDLFFTDTYSAFKGALFDFIQGVICRDVRINSEFMLEVVNLIEYGRGGDC